LIHLRITHDGKYSGVTDLGCLFEDVSNLDSQPNLE
jgi:hypothetical protein